ncbi:unnamed protein product [Parascedosporium putredinis]|uniref:Ubiquitin-conjugating enzyme E2 2 n=1 Tax=Parascedosporium putredinis TaxID=1442378 RepID=A0A9P1M9Y8_9PEZI|nr:unnamed protein product [Parascedosporium putredinis]CAI7992967.1 unnamed protein product [Parascedosporium putredinis]
MAEKRLMMELQALQKEKWVHIDVNEADIKRWTVGLMVVNPDSVFSGGYFKADMSFPSDYPYRPPTFRFQKPVIYHPNIYTDGRLCISILHAPGEDEMSGEQASERWSPCRAPSRCFDRCCFFSTPPRSTPRQCGRLRDVPRPPRRLRQPSPADGGPVPQEHSRRRGVPDERGARGTPTKSGLDDDDFMNETDEESIGGSDSDMDDFDDDFEEEEEDDE